MKIAPNLPISHLNKLNKGTLINLVVGVPVLNIDIYDR